MIMNQVFIITNDVPTVCFFAGCFASFCHPMLFASVTLVRNLSLAALANMFGCVRFVLVAVFRSLCSIQALAAMFGCVRFVSETTDIINFHPKTKMVYCPVDCSFYRSALAQMLFMRHSADSTPALARAGGPVRRLHRAHSVGADAVIVKPLRSWQLRKVPGTHVKHTES